MQMKIKMGADEVDDVLDAFSAEVKDVAQHNGLITWLGNKAMRTRHWEKVYALTKQPFGGLDMGSGGITFNRLLEDGADQFKDEIEEISGQAQGEKQIEDTMQEIKDKWAELNFTVTDYRGSKERFIVKEVEEVITVLEDDSMTISTMLGSKHVREIRDEVEDWERKLGYVSDVIDEWLAFQKAWMYLENIFNAEDIQTQLKNETKQFLLVDKFWKDHMTRAKKEPRVVMFADHGALLKKFVENNKKLDEIQKGLEDYLETKRSSFPRFYFLSNDELIEILSQTRNVQAVQPHLGKCFDAIKKVAFTTEPDSKEVVGMFSPENEYVEFATSVFAEGPVETWLAKIEQMMIQSLYDRTKVALQDYPADGTQRDEWLFDYAAQPILTVDMIVWTASVTKAIQEVAGGTNGGALV
jgi:dynein heavy chain